MIEETVTMDTNGVERAAGESPQKAPGFVYLRLLAVGVLTVVVFGAARGFGADWFGAAG
jgi:hypothetical protein